MESDRLAHAVSHPTHRLQSEPEQAPARPSLEPRMPHGAMRIAANDSSDAPGKPITVCVLLLRLYPMRRSARGRSIDLVWAVWLERAGRPAGNRGRPVRLLIVTVEGLYPACAVDQDAEQS